MCKGRITDGRSDLSTKKLLESKYQWLKSKEEAMAITKQELRWLLEGLSIEQKRVFKETSKRIF
ncbi:IS66 family insertion sequence element accessory protein TnpB [[Clostridium] innocuum]|nr:IS66 family insertion sequence element accessory protein TnpB [[Clostridium] innocuum]